jgi:hypothetical protein
MRGEHFAIRKPFDPRQVFESLVEAGQKGVMLKPSDDFQVFLTGDIS